MSTILQQIGACRLVPVIALHDAAQAAPLGEALVAGGLPCAEVTFRTAAAAESIRIMAENTDLLVGAGTVLTIDQVKQAVDSGAKFMVSPGFNPKVVGYCVDHDIPITPGTSNPTDIEMALEFGLDVVKFFPAEAFGGLKTLKAISAPYSAVRFIPTGGISESNLQSYLAFPKVLACGGSWMVPNALISDGRFEEVAGLVSRAVTLANA